MPDVKLWVQRAFQFDLPVELYPNVLMRLRGTPARLEELLSDVPTPRLRQRVNGKWSMQEHAGHLIDLEALGEIRLQEFLDGAITLTAADMSNAATERARYNDRPLSEVLAGFRRHREGFLRKLDALDRDDFARSALHPRLNQPMRLIDLCLFHAEHDDHHLAWAHRLKTGGASSEGGAGRSSG